jgi:hypothetical protein
MQINSGGENGEGGLGTEDGVTLQDGQRTIHITWDIPEIPD